MYHFVYKRATLVAHLTNFSFELFYTIFTADASLLVLYHGAKKSKMTKNSNEGILRQDPLYAIIVIFGRRSFNLVVESSSKQMKKTSLLCACTVVITLETQHFDTGTRFVEFKLLMNRNRQKIDGFCRRKEKGQPYKTMP